MLCSFQFETESEGTRLRRDVLAEGNTGLGPSTTGLVAILSGQEEMFAFRRAVCTRPLSLLCMNSLLLFSYDLRAPMKSRRCGSRVIIGICLLPSRLLDWKQDAVDAHFYWFYTFTCVINCEAHLVLQISRLIEMQTPLYLERVQDVHPSFRLQRPPGPASNRSAVPQPAPAV